MADEARPLPFDVSVEGPTLDVTAVRARLRQRARRRTAARAGALTAIVLVAGLAVPRVLPDPAPVELAVGEAALPTRLPDGYAVCAQMEGGGGVLRTELCGAGRPDLVLEQGPHDALPEDGAPIPVARRTGFVVRTAAGISVTVSDANTAADVHHRLRSLDASMDPQVLADVLATIPTVADAEPSR